MRRQKKSIYIYKAVHISDADTGKSASTYCARYTYSTVCMCFQYVRPRCSPHHPYTPFPPPPHPANLLLWSRKKSFTIQKHIDDIFFLRVPTGVAIIKSLAFPSIACMVCPCPTFRRANVCMFFLCLIFSYCLH